MENRQKVRLFSRLLRVVCYIGMVATALLPLGNWFYQGIPAVDFNKLKWLIDFSNLPVEHKEYISFSNRALGCFIDLIKNFFFFAAFLFLSKLLKLFEQFQFFTKRNVHYLRLIGIYLLLSQVVQPFYILLRAYIWTIPGQRIVVALDNWVGIKIVFLAILVYLLAYIFEEGSLLEDEYNKTI